MTDRDPLHLHPLARALDEKLAAKALGYGIGTTLIETHRDNAGQMTAWRSGRDAEDRIIDRSKVLTWKRPGDSWHNLTMPDGTPCSLAFHRAIRVDRDGKIGLLGFGDVPLDAIGTEMYNVLSRIGVSLGLRSLASVGDFTHFEVRGYGTIEQVKDAILNGVDLAELRKA